MHLGVFCGRPLFYLNQPCVLLLILILGDFSEDSVLEFDFEAQYRKQSRTNDAGPISIIDLCEAIEAI